MLVADTFVAGCMLAVDSSHGCRTYGNCCVHFDMSDIGNSVAAVGIVVTAAERCKKHSVWWFSEYSLVFVAAVHRKGLVGSIGSLGYILVLVAMMLRSPALCCKLSIYFVLLEMTEIEINGWFDWALESSVNILYL